MTKPTFFAVLLLALSFTPAHATDLDLAASKITVHVEKSGLFSAFAHNHTISAPLASGHLDIEKRTIELKFRSQEMKVLDPEASDSERANIEHTMKSDQVLDPARFPEIRFVSTSVEAPGPRKSHPAWCYQAHRDVGVAFPRRPLFRESHLETNRLRYRPGKNRRRHYPSERSHRDRVRNCGEVIWHSEASVGKARVGRTLPSAWLRAGFVRRL